jgi:hypothetical protein
MPALKRVLTASRQSLIGLPSGSSPTDLIYSAFSSASSTICSSRSSVISPSSSTSMTPFSSYIALPTTMNPVPGGATGFSDSGSGVAPRLIGLATYMKPRALDFRTVAWINSPTAFRRD